MDGADVGSNQVLVLEMLFERRPIVDMDKPKELLTDARSGKKAYHGIPYVAFYQNTPKIILPTN
jgi:hypothetical protein